MSRPSNYVFLTKSTSGCFHRPPILYVTLCFDGSVSSLQVLGVTSKELIPKGTRFGPLVGESYTNETLLKDANRKYFWRVSEMHLYGLHALAHDVSKTVHILYLHLERLWCGTG